MHNRCDEDPRAMHDPRVGSEGERTGNSVLNARRCPCLQELTFTTPQMFRAGHPEGNNSSGKERKKERRDLTLQSRPEQRTTAMYAPRSLQRETGYSVATSDGNSRSHKDHRTKRTRQRTSQGMMLLNQCHFVKYSIDFPTARSSCWSPPHPISLKTPSEKSAFK